MKQSNKKDLKWTQSIAVGDKRFIEKTKKLLSDKANGRQTVNSEAGYELKETQTPYGNTANKKNESANKLSWDLGFG